MSKTFSVVLVLLLATIGHVWADPLTADMMKLNAQWDAAINDPNFDALLPMYAADASLILALPSGYLACSRSLTAFLTS